MGIESFLDYLDEVVGAEGAYSRISEEGEQPGLWVIRYANAPNRGELVAFTYGLSSVDHPQWKHGRPELMIHVSSSNMDWATAMGALAYRFRGTSSFAYGSVFRLNEKVCDESEMTSFFVFANSLLDNEQSRVVLEDRIINIVQLYPIYEEEISIIDGIGPKRFFMDESRVFEDIHRPLKI